MHTTPTAVQTKLVRLALLENASKPDPTPTLINADLFEKTALVSKTGFSRKGRKGTKFAKLFFAFFISLRSLREGFPAKVGRAEKTSQISVKSLIFSEHT